MIQIVDVSGWQGHDVDMGLVAQDGISGVYIKATQGKSYTSGNFLEYWIWTRACKMAPGAYHFLEKDVDPVAQADHFLSVYKQVAPNGALPPCLDVERAWGGGDRACVEASLIVLRKITAETGMKPIVYTYAAFGAVFHLYPEMAEYKLWLADYRSSVQVTWPVASSPWSEVAIHQYTGTGSIPGIAGTADRSRSKYTIDELNT